MFRKGMNVGFRPGKPSRIDGMYLHVIDLDIRDEERRDEAQEALETLFEGRDLGKMWRAKSGSGGSSRHYYFLTDVDFPTENLARSEDFMLVDGRKRRVWEIDLLGTGKNCVLPPSIHPDTGDAYAWIIEPDDYPVHVDADWLMSILEPETYEPADNDEPMGLSWAEGEDILRTVEHLADDHETWVRVGMGLKHEFGEDGWEMFDAWSKRGHGYNRKDNLYQWKRFNTDRREIVTMRSVAAEAREVELDDLIGDLDDGETVREEVALEQAKEALAEPEAERKAPVRKKGDPNMALLSESNGVKAAKLPLHILGKRLGDQVRQQAHSAASSPDFVFAAILAGASAVIGNAIRIRIREGFEQAPIVWCEIIGEPSSNKSPSMRSVTSALTKLEAKYEPYYREAMKKWEEQKEKSDGLFKAWTARNKAMQAEGKDVFEDRPDNTYAPPQPFKRPFIHNDMTIESFITTQAQAPRGFMVFRDELNGWLASMERYSSETDRAIWLESYDGGSYTVSRQKYTETLRVPHVCAPILGGIQPERLLAITNESSVDDGLQARLMPFWPDAKFKPMSDTGMDNTEIVRMFEKLSEITMDKDTHDNPIPRMLPFTRPAFDAFKAWSDNRKQDEQNAPTRLKGVYGKAEGQVARIAGILQLLWWAAEDDFDEGPVPKTVNIEAVKAAITFREEYLKPTQQRVFQHAIEPDEVINARVIANWIIAEDMGTVNLRTMRREAGLKGMRNTAEKTKVEIIDAAISTLVHDRWLIEQREEGKAGRPSKSFEVNPRVWELLQP